MYREIIGLFFLVCLFSACQEKLENPNKTLTMDAFSEMKTSDYSLSSRRIREYIDQMMKVDRGGLAADKRLRAYYGAGSPFLWIDRKGIDERADSLLAHLSDVEEAGLNVKIFRKKEIADDLKRLRALEVDNDTNSLNRLMARLEYNLTRAYLRYTAGQHFGYVNPEYVLNHYDVKDSNAYRVVYHQVFDVKMHHADQAFFGKALRKVGKDSVAPFLREVQPVGKLYNQLCQRLRRNDLTKQERILTICNIERCRWRLDDYPERHKKYVLVNVPAYELYAVSPDSVLTMRIACGALKTKSPLLSSRITRMDINPQWIVPKSIAKGIVYSTGYLHRNHMFIYDSKEGRLDASRASYSRIMDGKQHIVQEGGPGNSLGRIIFRFPNDHAVYLHDTSSPWLFKNARRALSHGCIRVEKPYELALFLHGDDDDQVAEKLRYSMTTKILPREDLSEEEREKIDRDKLIHTLHVKPEVPVYITYYTLYPNAQGDITEYHDVYGYDKVLTQHLRPFMEEGLLPPEKPKEEKKKPEETKPQEEVIQVTETTAPAAGDEHPTHQEVKKEEVKKEEVKTDEQKKTE